MNRAANALQFRLTKEEWLPIYNNELQIVIDAWEKLPRNLQHEIAMIVREAATEPPSVP